MIFLHMHALVLHAVRLSTCVYLDVQTVVAAGDTLTNQGYFDHRKNLNVPNGAPCW